MSMVQYHVAQDGLFHLTTNARKRAPWCTMPGVPERLLQDLFVAKVLYQTKIYAFCILPNHMHMIVCPGPKGLTNFMTSFKKNSSRNIGKLLRSRNDGYVTVVSGQEEVSFTGWQHGFHDELIRDHDQRQKAMHYVQWNALKHGLVDDPNAWPWSSLRLPEMVDGFEMW